MAPRVDPRGTVVIHGEVWWGEQPEAGRRPYLILTRDRAIPVLQKVLVATVTRRVRGIPTEVPIDETDGMPQACAVALDDLGTVRKALLTQWICTLSAARMVEVCVALRLATSC